MNNIQRKDDLQYIADTILVEKLARADAEIIKGAGIFGELGLGGIASSIKNHFAEKVGESGGGTAGTVLNFLVPTVLFRINPVLGIVSLLLDSIFGFNLGALLGKMVDKLKPKIESGKPISSAEVSSIGQSVIQSEAGALSSSACNDMFYGLRKYCDEDSLDSLDDPSPLVSFALFGRRKQTPDIPGLFPKRKGFGGNVGVIGRIFGNLFKRPRGASLLKWFGGGLLLWTLKTALIGAGLIAGAGALRGLMGRDKGKKEQPETPSARRETTEAVVPASYTAPATARTPTRRTTTTPKAAPGTVSSGSYWVVPLVGGSVENMLLVWATDIYRDLVGYDDIIMSSPSFRRVVRDFERNYSSAMPNRLVIPPKHYRPADAPKTRIRKIVDKFSGPARRAIRNKKSAEGKNE